MKTKMFGFFISTVLITALSGCTHWPVDQFGRGWDHMMGYGGYGGMFMWLIWIVIAAVIIYFVFNLSKRNGKSIDSENESPIEILKRRYAKGEITKEEFDRIKREIEN
jgi:putative membrane protein